MSPLYRAVIYIAEAMIAWLYFETVFPPKTKVGVRILSFLAGYGLLFCVYYTRRYTLWPSPLWACLVNVPLALLNYRCTGKGGFLRGVFLGAAAYVSEELAFLAIDTMTSRINTLNYHFNTTLVLVVISRLCYMVVTAVGARLHKPDPAANRDSRLVALFYGLPVFSICVVSFAFFRLSSLDDNLIMVMLLILLLVVHVLFLLVYNYLQKTNAHHTALQLQMQKEQADTEYYQAMQEQFENQRILIHDIKNHLHTLDTLARAGKNREITDYIGSLQMGLLPASQAKLCTDPILNMILLRYARQCQAQGVDFRCDIRENTAGFLDGPGITTLFGNLLSNALEAAVQAQKPQIEVTVRCNAAQSHVLVSVINACAGPVQPDGDGNYPSTKKDGAYHGIGLKSIQRIVEEHGGVSTMYYDSQDRSFHHLLQFPKKKE